MKEPPGKGPPKRWQAPTPRRVDATRQHSPQDRKLTSSLTPGHGAPAAAALDFETGYRIGYGNGYSAGYAHGSQDVDAAWGAILTGHAETWRRPRYAELQTRRETLRRCRCDRCSACVRWAAIRRNRARYGQDNFPGVAA
jgi:hypothetical protein